MMIKIKYSLLAVIILTGLSLGSIDDLHNLGYVVVSPQGPIDGGDYGPYTPGTTTAGFQEAFDYTKTAVREVYIIGGPDVTYELSSTLTIPWGQDWHSDAGNFNMVFTQTSGDCLVLDSQMNCRFQFGVISAPNLQNGSIVRVWPQTQGPDEFIVCVNIILDVTAIIGSGSNYATYGLRFDGPTVLSHINVGRIEQCGIGLSINGGSNNNIVGCGLITDCSLMVSVNGGSSYILTAAMDAGSVSGANGASISNGSTNNVFYLKWKDGFEPGRALYPGTSPSNIIYAGNLNTDNFSASVSSRIFQDRTIGFNVTTPSVPLSSVKKTNYSGYPVIVTIKNPGSVTGYTISDANNQSQTVNGSMFAGQTIYLEPSEGITLVYSGTTPTWVWKALR